MNPPDANSILLNNVAWFACVATVGALLVAALVFGVKNFGTLFGKIVTVLAGVLLLGLVLFVGGVLLIVWSGNQGHPF